MSELLDMSFVEMTTIADFSIDERMSLINRTLQEIVANVPDLGLLNCWQILPNAGSYFVIREATILTIIANCCNQLMIQDRNRAEMTLPDSAVYDETAKYTIPDAYNLYKSRTWMISLIPFHQFRGELHNNQRIALLELFFLIRRYAPDRGIVEPVFVFNPRNSAIYETLSVEAPDILRKLSPSDSTEEVVWNNSTVRTSFGIFASAASTMLDMITLSKGFMSDILPYEDFLKFSDHSLDELIITDELLTGGQHQLDCSRFVLNVEAEFLGERWNVSRYKCLLDQCVEPYFAEAVVTSTSKNMGCVYPKMQLCRGGKGAVSQWRYASFEYLRTRAFLRFSEAVVTLALAFIQREFDGAPFLGVHWRRGDRLVYRGLTVDVEAVVAQTWQACEEKDLAEVYLMTNCGLHEKVAAVVGDLASLGIRVRIAEAFRGWEEEDKRLALEMAIMSFAEHLLISFSAVSSTILEERLLLGHPPGSWSSLAPESDSTLEYEEFARSLQRDLHEQPDLGRAVESQAGLAHRVLDCLHDTPAAAATPAACAALVINSSRFVASCLA